VLILINSEEIDMHIDENKKFDKRNIEKNLKDGIITQKDYETYLAKLPDASDKVFNPEDYDAEMKESELQAEGESSSRKKTVKKKAKGKGK
jgi:hypothetical protein